jgi:hypothetical protein
VPERKWLDALEECGHLGPLDRGSRADGNHTGKIQVAPSRVDGGTVSAYAGSASANAGHHSDLKPERPPGSEPRAQRAHEEKVKDENATTWLIPKLVGEVKFTEWTSEDEMRHPAFLGLRTDKKALDVIREQT